MFPRKSIPDSPGLRARKRLGQNFILDASILRDIVDCCDIQANDQVVEIGAGPGNLTSLLARCGETVFAVEKDKRFEPLLKDVQKTFPKLQIMIADILQFKLKDIFSGKLFTIVGNLPYYITSPILNHLIDQREYISAICVTVQKEVAKRMTASPGGRDYGRLSCLLQYYTDPVICRDIPRRFFQPRPEVDSSLVKITIRKTPAVKVKSEKLFFRLIKGAFSQRRKTLLNSIAGSGMFQVTKEEITGLIRSADIDPGQRAEQLSLSDFARMADLFHEHLQS